MTQTAAVVGTAQYLSPEQARGETVDSRSDVYSTGCLLYELLTGRPPFVGDSPVSVAYQHVREQAAPPSTHDADLPPEVDAIVMKALAKRVEDRYQQRRRDAGRHRALPRRPAGRRRPVVPPPVDGTDVPAVADDHAGRPRPTPRRRRDDDEPSASGTGLWILLGAAARRADRGGVRPRAAAVRRRRPSSVQVPDVIGLDRGQARDRRSATPASRSATSTSEAERGRARGPGDLPGPGGASEYVDPGRPRSTSWSPPASRRWRCPTCVG